MFLGFQPKSRLNVANLEGRHNPVESQNVETVGMLCQSVAAEIFLGSSRETVHAVGINSIFGQGVVGVGAGFDLHEDHLAIVVGNDVHLAILSLPVALEDAVIVLEQIIARFILTLFAKNVVESHCIYNFKIYNVQF